MEEKNSETARGGPIRGDEVKLFLEEDEDGTIRGEEVQVILGEDEAKSVRKLEGL